MHFSGQLSKCMVITLLIDILMLISHPIDKIYLFCFTHDWYPAIKTIPLQVIFKMYIIFAGYWWNKQWFYKGSIITKHNTSFPKWMIFMSLIMKMHDYFTTNQQNSKFFLIVIFWIFLAANIFKMCFFSYTIFPKINETRDKLSKYGLGANTF